MPKQLTFPRVSLTDATTGKRLRVSGFAPGAALVPVPQPEPILGYCYQAGHLTVYVSGTMPLDMRSAQEQGCTDQEAWLVDELPAGIKEIDLTDCRREFSLLKAA
ncbi:hypothetical protein GO988_11310 [Hymenobacter sp. HMF4947]|uniref:Uncharacterized protein n=1 Tax=Hymenobacter ginkgonis TaxID=2682976 RepID=A0A7K1TF37_9BACT|nr:hypothetical protein [Hymenobacter ginkgonis]MVN76912.1 hypothetical protein [Hymenobacter ginkgonis]